jgi:hypothetical protein
MGDELRAISYVAGGAAGTIIIEYLMLRMMAWWDRRQAQDKHQ